MRQLRMHTKISSSPIPSPLYTWIHPMPGPTSLRTSLLPGQFQLAGESSNARDVLHVEDGLLEQTSFPSSSCPCLCCAATRTSLSPARLARTKMAVCSLNKGDDVGYVAILLAPTTSLYTVLYGLGRTRKTRETRFLRLRKEGTRKWTRARPRGCPTL